MKRIEFHIHQLVNASHLLLKGAEQVFRKLTLAILTVYYIHFFLHNFFLTVLYGRCDTFELLPDAHLSLRAFLPSWCFSFLHRTQLRPVCKLKFFMAHCTKSGSWRMNKAHSIKPYRTEWKQKIQCIQICWDDAKAVLRGMLPAMNAYIRNEEKSQVNNPSVYLKSLEKEKQNKPKTRRRKE